MISGAFSIGNKNQNNTANYLISIDKEVSWKNASVKTYNYHSLCVNFFSHVDLPARPENHWYIDDKSEIAVFFDGHLYNRYVLLSSIQTISESLAELIYRLFSRDNLSFIDLLNGDFSIGIFDFRKKEYFLIKDHVGITPLSFVKIDEAFYFSSDTMGLARGLFKSEIIDPEFILSTFLHYEETFAFAPNKCIIKIPPGHYAKITEDSVTMIKHWFPEKIAINTRRNFEETYIQLNELVIDSVRIRSDSNYRAGAHISGGLDSSLIAALARKMNPDQTPFYGFTWSPEDEIDPGTILFDERNWINQQCLKSEIQPVHANFDEQDIWNAYQNWRLPSMEIFEQMIRREAKDFGVNLIFSGWGGDEFLSIGNPYLDYDLFYEGRFKKFLQLHPVSKPKKLAKALLHNVLIPRKRISYLKYKTYPFLFDYIKNGLKSNKLNPVKRSSYTNRQGIHLGYLDYKHLSQRCEDWYIAGQRSGIEYRYPLLDKRIIEFILTIPTKHFAQKGTDRIFSRLIGKELLINEIKNVSQKNDPVNSYIFRKKTQALIPRLITEISAIKSNSYLQFVDFNLLEKNVKSETNKDGSPSRELFFILHHLKVAHEFTKAFHADKLST